MGRRTLAKATGLTEMTVRMAVDSMRADGLVRATRAGICLERIAGSMQREAPPVLTISELPLRMVESLPCCLAAHLRSATPPSAWRLRDLAVAQGATVLLSLVYDHGGWAFSNDLEPVERRNRDDAASLQCAFPTATVGDVMVCVGGADRGDVGCALWAVLLASAAGGPSHPSR